MKRFGLSVLVLLLVVGAATVSTGCKKKKPVVIKDGKQVQVADDGQVEPEPIYWPLTGLESDDATAVTRRPISVKVENSPQAQPQTGLNSADVLYESMIEGAESRFNAIYQSTIPDEVGPVRSVRHTDLWIVPQFQTVLFYSGGNSEVRGKVKAAKLDNYNQTTGSKVFHRVDWRVTPHNLYLKLNKVYAFLEKKGVATTVDTPTTLSFDSAATTYTADGALGGFPGRAVKSVNVHYYQHAKWSWNAERKVWTRTTAGKKHLDKATGEQLWVDNVVLMYANYTTAQKKDPAGNPTYDTDMGGSGKAVLFRNGYAYKCTWKAERKQAPRLYDENGRELTLQAGRTCFEVVPKKMLKVKISYRDTGE
ncbi:MAG: DUF3048 domain-containing protein [Actinomycetes bacterium]|nr:DUF3048 domain-containing protein [Actinomycetes bacterium]